MNFNVNTNTIKQFGMNAAAFLGYVKSVYDAKVADGEIHADEAVGISRKQFVEDLGVSMNTQIRFERLFEDAKYFSVSRNNGAGSPNTYKLNKIALK